MWLVRLAAAALNQTPLDWDNNRANIEAALQAARQRGVGVLCLPELCITGYGCEDAFLSPGVRRTAMDVLLEIVPKTSGLVVCLGLPLEHAKGTYNACALAADGRLAGFVAKRALAGDGIHYEPRWFKPWPRGQRTYIRIGGQEIPIGDIYFDCGGLKIGFEICEDAWMAQRPGAELALDAVDIILNPSASHFAFGKHEVRRRLVLESSRALGVSYVYSNLLGNEAGRAIYDGDLLIASAGEMVAHGQRFSFEPTLLATGLVDIELVRSRQSALSGFEPRVAPLHDECVCVPFEAAHVDPEPNQAEPEAWEALGSAKNEEFARAVTLGLFDYLRKSRSRGFVVSLSGGVDSAVVACLAAYSVRYALRWLGLEGLRNRLGFIPGIHERSTARELISELLTTVYQKTNNSSQVTRDAARGVAEELGSRHLELDVNPLVESYVSMVSASLGRTLSWDHDDLALQNIQARARAPGVWMIANVRRALLLATSNRSEAAVGYATMDGDTAGGLSPIAGVDKAFLRRWILWMQSTGPAEMQPVAALEAVAVQAPTAELRPISAAQTDEADLMPYELLDVIERAAIRDKRMPLEVYELIKGRYPEYTPKDLVLWIERFFVLWSRNQWKRERYAPSFHLDDENLDPKTWCRFPVLSGGYARELRELKKNVPGS
ncbi:MAG: NAD(+) synthase [Polyangiaceae bacterium]|nr:NAD(+) synthase [Polyangiaceae bacterium]